MPNDSSTGGYISPVAPSSALFDAALDALLHDAIVGITGLDTNLVRPRWQSIVPKQPEPGIDWCAFGIIDTDPTDYPVETHDGSGGGSDTQQKWEEFTVLATFYGPNGSANASLLGRGLYIDQNREAMKDHDIDLIDAGKIVTAPDLVNQQWVKRRDLPIRFRRKVVSVYPVLNIASADDEIVTDTH